MTEHSLLKSLNLKRLHDNLSVLPSISISAIDMEFSFYDNLYPYSDNKIFLKLLLSSPVPLVAYN